MNTGRNENEADTDRNRATEIDHSSRYSILKHVATGSFGMVYKAIEISSGETVAIKKILEDPRYKSRELRIMKVLEHPNIIRLRQSYISKNDQQEEFLNLVMDFYPETIYTPIINVKKQNQPVPVVLIKYYLYQMIRALGHMHARQICHRDVKPLNFLLDPTKNTIHLCDFGSGKRLAPGESNIAYICSRFYRAPELIFGSTGYNESIDI